MSERLTVVDELVHERFVVTARGAWTDIFPILMWSALGIAMSVLACKGILKGEMGGWLLLALVLVFCGSMVALYASDLLRPARVITLTRGGVEAVAGRTRRVFPRRAIRFAELRYNVSRTRSGSFHRVSLWLSVELPDDPHTDVRNGWVSVLGMTLSDWGETESRHFAQLNDALARLGLRERLAPSPEAAAQGDPPPRFDVPEAQLESSLRGVLGGPRDLPEGARFLVDASRGEPGLYVFLFIVSLFFALPVDGALVASWHHDAGAWKLRGGADALGASLLTALGVGLAAVPVYLGWQIARRREVEARIRRGRWRWGLYLLPETLLVLREGRVLVMPRARVLGFTWPAQDAPHVQYRSAQGVSENLRLEWKPPSSVLLKEQLLADLEAWRTGATKG